MLKVSSAIALVSGVILLSCGIWGVAFTYTNVARENIITPEDASIPGVPVRGPLTLKAQADIIRVHMLKTTDGKTYAEMPRQIPKLDQDGTPVLDETGQTIMVPNTARDMWVTATTLTSALHLGILAYALSGAILLFGIVSIWVGILFSFLSKRQ